MLIRAHFIALCVATLIAVNAQTQTAPPTAKSAPESSAPAKTGSSALAPVVPKTPEGIVEFLLPDNLAHPGRLDQVPKADAINALTKAQPNAADQRADSIAFLLVLLGQNVDANRQHLLDSLRQCRTDPDNCNDRVIDYMGSLYARGDNLVIEPLLDSAPKADSVIAEELGSTFDDMISANPRPMMAALARRTPEQQREVCHMVAASDGGGMPEDVAADVTGALEKLAREVGPVSKAAMTCLSEVRAYVPGK